MDSKHIEQLLEKYWNCETSLEEESQLREYFSREDVPAALKETASLFRYFEQQKADRLANDFDEKVIRKVRRPEGKRVNLFFNYSRIAAGVLVVAASIYLVGQEIRKQRPTEAPDTYSDPKLAFEETKRALMMISKGFGKAHNESKKINLFHEAEQKIKVDKGETKDKAGS